MLEGHLQAGIEGGPLVPALPGATALVVLPADRF